MPSIELKERLLKVVSEYEEAYQVEHERNENNMHLLQSKILGYRQSMELKNHEIHQQAKIIDKLGIELELARRAGASRQANRDDTSSEVSLLRRQVAALRFEVADKYGEIHQLKKRLEAVMSKEAESEEKSEEGESPKSDRKHDADSDIPAIPAHLEPFSRVSLFSFARDGNYEAIESILEPKIGETDALPAISTFPSTLGVALSLAVANGHSEVCSMLLEHGAETSSVEPCTDRNVLHLAALTGQPGLLKMLLSSDEKVAQLLDSRDRDGDTPLHIATRNLFDECVLIMLRQGADPRMKDKNGQTPSEIAEAILKEAEKPPLLPRPKVVREDSIDSKENHAGNSESEHPEESTNDVTTPEQFEEIIKEKAVLAVGAKSTLGALNEVSSLFWAYSVRANRLYTQHKYVEAKNAYQAAVDLSDADPSQLTASNRATLHYNMARTAVQTDQHTEAVHHCTIALELKDGHYPNALCQRASSYMALYEYQRAVNDYQSLINLGESGDPNTQVGGKLPSDWTPQLQRAKQMLLRSQDHYAVLDVHPSATAAEIKKCFRKQCLKWHPDKHRGSEDSQARSLLMFKALNEANETLTDESKRAAYDLTRLAKNLNLYSSGGPSNNRRKTTSGFHRYDDQPSRTRSNSNTRSSSKPRGGAYRSEKPARDAHDFSYEDWYESFNQTAAKSADVRREKTRRTEAYREAKTTEVPESRPPAAGPTPKTERHSPVPDPTMDSGGTTSSSGSRVGSKAHKRSNSSSNGNESGLRGREQWSPFRPTNISAVLSSDDDEDGGNQSDSSISSGDGDTATRAAYLHSRKVAAKFASRNFRRAPSSDSVDNSNTTYSRESAAKVAAAATAFATEVGKGGRVGYMEEDEPSPFSDDRPGGSGTAFRRRRPAGATRSSTAHRDANDSSVPSQQEPNENSVPLSREPNENSEWTGLSATAEEKMRKATERLLAERRGTL